MTNSVSSATTHPFVDIWDDELFESVMRQVQEDDEGHCKTGRRKSRKKITLKNIFLEKDFRMKRPFRLHASFDNNMPMALQTDL